MTLLADILGKDAQYVWRRSEKAPAKLCRCLAFDESKRMLKLLVIQWGGVGAPMPGAAPFWVSLDMISQIFPYDSGVKP